MAKYKTLIGRFELMDFPAELLFDVPVKIDTGATTSSIHAYNIREVEKNGVKLLHFTILKDHASYDYSRELVAEKYSSTVIENSFGQSEKRFVVRLKVRLAKKAFYANFTLADRSKKSFPILVGRELLNGRFIIDTSICNVPKKLLETRMPKVLKEDIES